MVDTSPRQPRRIDHYRVLRSNGKPSFSTTKYTIEGDAERIATKPAVSVSRTLPLIEALKQMNEKKVRSLVVKDVGEKYWGMLLAEDTVNYLGGGELYDIVLNRFGGDVNKAINIPTEEIGRIKHPYVYAQSRLDEVIRSMLSEQIDIVTVVDKDERPVGVISVHDVLRYAKGLRINKTAKDAAINFIPAADYSSTLREALKQMCNTGLRFLLVKNELDQIIGYIDYKTIIAYFAGGQALKYIKRGSLEESLLIKVGELAKTDVTAVEEGLSLEEALTKMLEKNTGFALVVGQEEPIGILTEFDALLSLVSGE